MDDLRAQSDISLILSESPITFVDLLGKTETIDSYEKMKFFSEEGMRFYKWNQEYRLEYLKINESLDLCLDRIKKEGYDIVSQKQLVRNVVSGAIRLGRREVGVVFPTSLGSDGAISAISIRNIYEKYGPNGLKCYIDVYNNPSHTTILLNDQNYRDVAIDFLLIKAGIKVSSSARRDYSSSSLNNLAKKTIGESLEQITDEKDKYVEYVDELLEKTGNRLNELRTDYDDFLKRETDEFEQLKKTYEEKLQLSAPVDFMKGESKRYHNSFKIWASLSAFLSILLVAILVWATTQMVDAGNNMPKISILGHDLPVYSNIAIIATVTLLAYLIKNIIKIAMTARHMEQEYKQKYILTDFLLTISKSEKVEQTTKDSIILSLFEKADTGLIKYDTSDGSLLSSIVQNIKK